MFYPSIQYEDEGTLLKKVIEWLKPQQRNGIKVLRICDRYAKGYSDLFLCVKGHFVVIELKAKNGITKPHQELFIKEMLQCGAIGGVCKSIEDVSKYIQEACNGHTKKE